MARLRWRVFVESVWSPEASQLIDTPMPSHLHGHDRVTYAKNKRAALDLFKTLFPPDEDDDGK